MKLFLAKVPAIARDVIRKLSEEKDIEVANIQEAQLDIEAILKEFVRIDRELTERAKDLMQKRGMSYQEFGRVKRMLAEEQGLGSDEEDIAYVTNQILESFMLSPHVEEVFAEEGVLRRKVQQLLQKHSEVEQVLDQEVRQRIKNLQEGTTAWDVEYQRHMEQIKRKHKLTS